MFVQILVRESVTTNRGIDMERQYLVNFLKDSVITAERPNMTPVGWPCEFWASRKNFPGQCCWLLRERCQGHTWDVGQAIHNYRRCCFWLIRGSLSSHLRQLASEKAVIVQKIKAMLKIAEVCLKLQHRQSQARSIVELFTQWKFSRVPLWSQQKHFWTGEIDNPTAMLFWEQDLDRAGEVWKGSSMCQGLNASRLNIKRKASLHIHSDCTYKCLFFTNDHGKIKTSRFITRESFLPAPNIWTPKSLKLLAPSQAGRALCYTDLSHSRLRKISHAVPNKLLDQQDFFGDVPLILNHLMS